jgi:hypothetical protein
MWQLHINRGRGEWTLDGTFETVRDAVRRIIELEHYPIKGIHLEIFFESDHGTDEEAFGHLEHTGRGGRCYVVKRRVQ